MWVYSEVHIHVYTCTFFGVLFLYVGVGVCTVYYTTRDFSWLGIQLYKAGWLTRLIMHTCMCSHSHIY